MVTNWSLTRKHPVAVFFLVAFACSWIVWAVIVVVTDRMWRRRQVLW